MQAQPMPDNIVVLYDRRGRRRSKGNRPGARIGRAPGNKGRTFDPSAPTVEEIVDLLHACTDDAYGLRLRALTILLWRTGMRVSEALALTEHDLNADGEYGPEITIHNGKGGKRRTVGIDPWGWSELQPWLKHRRGLPIGELFCVLSGPTAGRAISDSCVRRDLKRLAARAGIRKRIAPHQFRHAFALEWDREGVRMTLLSRQLGHASAAVTAVYLRSISNDEVIERIGTRPVPMVPALSKGPGART